MRKRTLAGTLAGSIALVSTFGCASTHAERPRSFAIGRTAEPAAIAPLDIDVAVDGAGLPEGSATAQDGAAIYAASCRTCHGERIALRRWRPTALLDYIRRAMPPTAPRRLSARDLYAVTAYVLYADGRIAAHDIVDRDTLVGVQLNGSLIRP